MISSFWRNKRLIMQLSNREVLGRYRGSTLGLSWSFFNTILMLAIYAFVFSVIFKAHWGVSADESKTDFAIILFVGLCVMFTRKVYEKVGPLDEAFGRGFFEDDDYCRRVEQPGLSVVCAEDVFIHHHLSAPFNKLKSADRQALFEQNKAIYEAKCGTWTPHTYKNMEKK
jgi:GT2 family glycosyltransferase